MRRNPPEWMGALEEGKRYSVSSKPIESMRDTSGVLKDNFKPVGLWYACGDEWVDWLESEMQNWLADVKYVYEVVPNLPRILELDTENDVRAFGDQYGVPGYRGAVDVIDWKSVGRLCDGIEICPYQWSLRMERETGWYYPWDVASGCIWRPAGLKSLRLVAGI